VYRSPGSPSSVGRRSLLAFCRSLPHVTEDIKWGADLCFSIGGKIFAICDPKGGRRCSFKTTVGAFDVLTRRPGIKPAPYVGRYHWVVIEDPIAVSQEELEALIRESYDLVAARLPATIHSWEPISATSPGVTARSVQKPKEATISRRKNDRYPARLQVSR